MMLLLTSIVSGKAQGFVANRGQWPEQVVARADLPGLRLFVERDALVWVAYQTEGCHGSPKGEERHMEGHAWRSKFLGSQFRAESVQWTDSLRHTVNILIGNDPSRWGSNIVPVREIRMNDFYPGIDWVLRLDEEFKYEFHVKPGADPSRIRMAVEGVRTSKASDGRLAYASSVGTYHEDAPLSWTQQGIESQTKTPVPSKWQKRNGAWGYVLDDYPEDELLVIDPRMVGATYSGSLVDNWGFTATYDNDGNMYLGGIAFGPGYPTSMGAFQTTYAFGQPAGGTSHYDIVISKFSADGRQQLYATYLGGSGQEKPSSMVFDENSQSLLVFGRTNSTNFPTTAAAYQRFVSGGYDLLVTRLSTWGGMLASTLLGGTGNEGMNQVGTHYTTGSLHFNYGDDARGEIALTSSGEVLVTSNTESTNFPVSTTTGTVQAALGGSQDGLVAKLSPNLNQLLFSSYLGGGSMDAAYSVKAGGGDTVFVLGSTFSVTTFFPLISRGYDPTHNGLSDGFVMALKTGTPPFSGPSIISKTFCGTSAYDQNFLLERDFAGNIYVSGISMGTIPRFGTRYFQVGAKHYVQKYSPLLDTMLWSAPFILPLINGVPQTAGPTLSPTAFLVDRCGKIYLCGWGGNVNQSFNSNIQDMSGLTVTPNAYQSGTTGSDFYLMVLGPDADTLVYATYMGGSVSAEHVDGGTSRFSPEGIVYHAVCAGCGGNQDFPLNNPFAAYTSNLSNNCNALVFKLDLELVRPRAVLRITPGDTNVCIGSPILFENRGTTGSSQWWQIAQAGQPPVHTAQSNNTSFTFTSSGVYTIRLIVEGCQRYDTAYRTVVVSNPPVIRKFSPSPACPGDTVWLRVDSLDVNGNPLTVSWLSNPALLPPSASPYRRQAVVIGARWFYFDVFSSSGCVLRDSIQTLTVPPKPVFAQDTLRWCWGASASLSALPGYSSYRWANDVEITNINQANQNFNLLQPRWVTCRIYDDTCFHLDSVYLLPEITLTVSLGPDIYFCSQVSRQIIPVGGTSYYWSDGSSGPSYSLNASGSGFIWVIATDNNGCRSLPDTLRYFDDPVTASIYLQPSDTAYAPQAVSFNSTLTSNVDSVYWFFGDGDFSMDPNVVHTYADTGTFDGYMVAISRRSGCRDSIPFRIVVDTVILDYPNAFLPGSTGQNALFRSFFRNLREVDFKVFDRWGQMIFETNDLEVNWDGTSKGKEVMAGTYVYLAKGIGKNGADYLRKGLLHLIR